MLSELQKTQSLLAPSIPLGFLLELHPREANRRQMRGFTDSAIFFRLWDLFDTLREPEVIAILNPRQRDAASTFHDILRQLPWRTLPAFPHIKELPDDDLSPLLKPGRELHAALSEQASR